MAYLRGFTVELGADVKGLVDGINDAERSIRTLNRETGELNRSLKFDPRNVNLLAQRQKVVTERVEETNKRVEDLKKLQGELIKQQKDGKDVSEELRKTNTELEVTKSKLNGYNKALQEANREVMKYSGSSGQMIADLEEFGEGALKASNKLKGVSIAGGAAITGMSAAAVGFESAFAGVQKTMDDDITPQQLEKIRKGIIDMSKEVPASTTAISEVAESAGQLGIETENVLDFTRVMIDMGESTNLSADTAATSMARFANIVGMSQKDFDKLGSVIVELGNNFATTEREIMEMGMRLAGAGAQIGMSESDILALATALSSVGIEAQAGGSAFSKVMVDMQLAVETGSSRLDEFAKVAGKSAEEFADKFRKDAAGALLDFITGLGKLDDSGESAIKVLDDMEIKEVRLRDALLRAAGASELFSEAISDGSDAWDENIALTEEASVRYETTESKLATMKNQFIALGIQLGEVLLPFMKAFAEILGGLADLLGKLPKPVQAVAVGFTAIAAAASPVLWLTGKLSTKLGGLLGWLKGTSFGSQVFAKDLATAGAELVTTGSASTLATGKLSTLGTALGKGTASLGKAVAGLGGFKLALGAVAVAGVAKMVSSLREEAIPEVDLFADKLGESGDSVGGFERTIGTSMVEISKSTKENLGAVIESLDNMSMTYGEMYVGIEEVTAEGINKLIEQTNEYSETVVGKAKEDRDKQLEVANSLFEGNKTIKEEEIASITKLINDDYEGRKKKTEELQKRLNKINQQIKEQGTEATAEQKEEIDTILREMKENAVETMTDNEIEQKVILDRMNDYEKRMTAEQAADIVKKLNEQRDKSVSEAEAEYAERMKIAEDLRRGGTKEAIALADKVEAEAKRQKREAVREAEQLRTNGLNKLGKGYKDLHRDIDTESGKIKSVTGRLWSSMTTGASSAISWIKELGRTWLNTNFGTKTANVHYTSTGSVGNIPNRYNNGLYEVPVDNYRALLHKGERVLTANENKQLKQQGFLDSTRHKLKGAMENVVNNVDNSVVNNQFVLAGTYHIREEADIDKLAREFNRKLSQKGRF